MKKAYVITLWVICTCVLSLLLIYPSPAQAALGVPGTVSVEHDKEGKLIVQPPVLRKGQVLDFKSKSAALFVNFPECAEANFDTPAVAAAKVAEAAKDAAKDIKDTAGVSAAVKDAADKVADDAQTAAATFAAAVGDAAAVKAAAAKVAKAAKDAAKDIKDTAGVSAAVKDAADKVADDAQTAAKAAVDVKHECTIAFSKDKIKVKSYDKDTEEITVTLPIGGDVKIKAIDGVLKYKVYKKVDTAGVNSEDAKILKEYKAAIVDKDEAPTLYDNIAEIYKSGNIDNTFDGFFTDLVKHDSDFIKEAEDVNTLATYLKDTLKNLKSDKAAIEKVLAQLDIILAGAKGDPLKYGKVVVKSTVVLRFKESLDGFIKKVTKDKAHFDKHYDKKDKYDYLALYKGELLINIGRGRKAIAYETDGNYVGGVTSENITIYNTDYVYIYMQTKAGDETKYTTEISQDAVSDNKSIFKTMFVETPPVKPKPEVKKVEIKINHTPIFELRRITQGERFNADHIVTFTNSGKDGDKDTKEIGKTKIFVRGNYTYGIHTGFAFSNNETRGFSKNILNEVTQSTRQTTAPILTVTRFWFPRSYTGDSIEKWQGWVPNPFVGFRIDSPGQDMFYGFSVEPVRGVNFLAGWNYGKRKVLSGGQSVGDDIDIAEVSTTDRYETDTFWGVTFDVNLFADKVLALAGF